MSKKISSSTRSGTSAGQTRKSTEKSGSKKSGGTKEAGKSETTKESKKSEGIKSSLKPEKECPPDSLNISPDAVEGKKGPEKEIEASDFFEKLDEVREGVINEPEVKTPSLEKGEVDFNELKEILNKREDKGEKADIKSLFAGTDKEIEIGSKAFKKLEGAGRRKEDDRLKDRDYEKPQESREDVHSLWDDTGVGARSRRDDLDGDAGGRRHDKDKPVADKGPEQFREKENREKFEASAEGKGEAGVKDESKLKASAGGKGEAGVKDESNLKASAGGKGEAGVEDKCGATSVKDKKDGRVKDKGEVKNTETDKDDKKVDNKKPPEIDKTNLTDTDKKIIEELKLDSLQPGEKMTISGEALAKVGVGLEGVADAKIEGGSNINFTIERDLEDPNKFVLTTGAGMILKISGEGNEVSGSGIKGEGGTEFGGSLALEMDFSKEGEATETGAFLLRSALMAAGSLDETGVVKTAADTLETLAQFAGLPGNPTDFIINHFKSLEVSKTDNKQVALELGKVLKLKPELVANLSTGGKLEHNDDGSWTSTASVGTGLAFNLKGAVSIGPEGEVPGVKVEGGVETSLASLEGNLSLEQSLTLKDGELIPETVFKMGLSGKGRGKGVEAELSISLSNLKALNLKDVNAVDDLTKAIERGDYDLARDIFKERILPDPNLKLNGSYRTFETTQVEAELNVEVIEGAGGGGQIKGGYENEKTLSSHEGSVTFDREGISFEGTHYENEVKQEGDEPFRITWQDMSGEMSEYSSDMEELSYQK